MGRTQPAYPLVVEFVAAFTAEWNRLAPEASAGVEARHREIEGVRRKLAGLVETIAEGLRDAWRAGRDRPPGLCAARNRQPPRPGPSGRSTAAAAVVTAAAPALAALPPVLVPPLGLRGVIAPPGSRCRRCQSRLASQCPSRRRRPRATRPTPVPRCRPWLRRGHQAAAPARSWCPARSAPPSPRPAARPPEPRRRRATSRS